jgi:AcrR family transcriptional regulator
MDAKRTMTDDDSLLQRAAHRAVADRHAVAVEDVLRLVEAAYAVVARTGSFDPTIRDILRESGLSTQAFYRHFASKDDLMLVLLDDGRRQLLDYLRHRMAKASTPEDAVRAWVEGVMAQAVDATAATRTRPFLLNQDRLAEKFPAEQQASIDLLVGLLVPPLAELRIEGGDPLADATAIYHLAFSVMRQHAVTGTRPAAPDVDHLVAFALAGAGVRPRHSKPRAKAKAPARATTRGATP